MLKSEAAAYLAGVSQTEGAQASAPTNLHVISGEVGEKSEDGSVRIYIDGTMFSEADEQYIEVDTLGGLEEGDVATILLSGESGHAMTPLAIGSVGSIDRIDIRIASIEADYVKATLLEADVANLGFLTAESATITDLQAADVTINGSLEAATGRIGTLEANTADISTIRANSVKVANLTAAQLEAGSAYISALNAGSISASDIIADHSTVGSLDANYAQINLANVNNAWITNGVVKDASIADAKIIGMSANKLTAGTIDASNITVTNLNASNITAGTLNGQRIGTGSLSLDKLSDDVYTESEIDGIVDNLNARIDAQIETWTVDAVPTLNNSPASSWTTNDLKAEHVGDICYVINSGNDYDGYTYRFAYDNSTSTYGWVLIKDNQVTAALGRITDLETFETNTSSWITNTDTELTSIKSAATTLTGRVDKTLVETTQLWYSKANTTAPNKPTAKVTSTSTSGNAWRTVVPAYNASYPNYFYCYQWKYSDGTYGWSSVTRDIAMGETQSTSRTADTNASTALTNAATAQTTANSAIKSSVQLWFTKANTTAPSKPTTQVTTNDATTGNAWNLTVPTYNASYPYYYYCYQQQKADDTWQWSDVIYDRATTENQKNSHDALTGLTTKVETSTFNTLSQTVDTNTANITSLTTITENNGLTSSTNITNTVNTVQQTASGNSSKISSLTTTLGTNADGTTKTGDIVHRTSAVEQDLSGFKTTVSSTYATKTELAGKADDSDLTTLAGRVTTAETNISQNTDAIALRATKTETYQSAQPNLSPFFDIAPNDTGYWFTTSNLRAYTTPLGDGWSHINTSSLNLNVSPRVGCLALKESTDYTIMLEVRNVTTLTSCKLYSYTANNSVWDESLSTSISGEGTYYRKATTKSDLSSSTITHVRIFLGNSSGSPVVNADVRLSIYEGDYNGPYKPYSGVQLYATQAELVDKADGSDLTALASRVTTNETAIEQNAGAIALRATKTEVAETYATKKQLDNRVEEELSFLYRATSDTEGVQDGIARIGALKGNTVVWNQLVPDHADYSYTHNMQPVSFSYAAGTYEVTVVVSGDVTGNVDLPVTSNAMDWSRLPLVSNHKYCLPGSYYRSTSPTKPCFYVVGAGNSIGYNNTTGVFTYANNDTSTAVMRVRVLPGTPEGTYKIRVQLFDLTLMFGAGNEPATVAEFEAMYPLPYYPYSTPTLKPVSITGIKSTGFNLWDEEWESGGINSSTGADVSNNAQIRSKNYIPVMAGTYYVKAPVGLWMWCYDANKRYLFRISKSGVGDTGSTKDNTISVPGGVAFVRFACTGTTYNHDVCINLSDPSRNGTYEPHWSQERSIPMSTYFPTGLKSAGSVYDELTETQAVKRVGSVDLGTLTWTYSNGFFRTQDLTSIILKPANNNTPADAKCSKYEIASWNSEPDKSVMVSRGTSDPLIVKDTDYTDAAAFKTAMSGVMLYYALATPTTTPISPTLNLVYKIDHGGTEEVMLDTTATAPQSAPILMSVTYGMSLNDYLEDNILRLSETQAELEVQANEISMKVSESDVTGNYLVGKINLDATTATIAASKVNIEGAAIFTGNGRLSQTSLDGAYDANGAAAAAQTAAQGYADSAVSNGVSGKADSSSANSREQLIYRSAVANTSSMSATTTWITDVTGGQNKWTANRPEYSSSYPVLFVATQRQTVAQSSGTTCSCTTPQIDQTITVIDGGHITTGTIDTNRLNAATIKSNIVQTTDLSASKITSGDISADRIKANVISAINSLTAGQIDAARINASQLTIGQSQVTGLTTALDDKADTADIPTNVSDLTNDSGFQTSSQVESAIIGKGYQTSSQVESAITSKGYATTSQAQGYATTAKDEAISAAATDATTKANAVQDNLNATRAWYAECPTAAGNAAKVATITPATTDFALAEGVTVAVKFTYANGVASPTLNVNNTGGKSIKRYGTTAPSTSAASSWNAGNVVTLVYDGTYWQMTNWLNNNDNYYDRENYKAALAASTEIAAGRVAAMGSDNKLKILAANSAFDISGPILYVGTAYSAANVTDGATRATNYTFWGTPFALTNTHAITGAAAGKPVYIVGTLSGNMFTPNSDVFTCTTPTSTDNLVYMRLGIMSTTANAVLESQHPLYMYFNGAFQQCDKSTADAAKTATNYISLDTDGIKIADANPSSATTYLQLASTFLDFVRGGVSMLKAWVDGSVAKVRVGAESGFNTLTDNEGIKLRSGTTVLSQFAANLIELGKNSLDSVISLCGGKAKIEYDGRTMFSMTGTSGAEAMHYMLIGSDGTQSEDAFSAISAEGHAKTNRAVISVYATYDDSQTSLAGIYAERLNLSYWGGASIVTDVYFPMSSVVNAIPVTLYDNASASASAAATLSETAANFKRLTIFFKDTDGNYSSTEVWSPNGKRIALSLTWINGASTQEMYQRVRWVTISGTSISTYKASGDSKYRTGQIKLGATASVTNSDYIAITHVIGYR